MHENLMLVKLIIMMEQIELTVICTDLTTRICLLGLDAQKFRSTKIYIRLHYVTNIQHQRFSKSKICSPVANVF